MEGTHDRAATPNGALDELVAEQAAGNQRRTLILVGAAALNAGIIALVFAGTAGGASAALVLAGILVVFVAIAYLVYDRSILGSTGATEPTPVEAALLMPMVDRLCARLGMPRPRVLVMDDSAANAFAIGTNPSNATIVFTRPILALLPPDELEAVAAHELAHIANGDTRVAMLSAALLGWALVVSAIGGFFAIGLGAIGIGMAVGCGDADDLTGVLASLITGICLIVFAIVAWLALQSWFMIARLADLAVHRQREWLADATAARLTGNPLMLAGALARLEGQQVTLAHGRRVAQSLCVAGQPMTGSRLKDFFNTHPSPEARIERLTELAAAGGVGRGPSHSAFASGSATDDRAAATRNPEPRFVSDRQSVPSAVVSSRVGVLADQRRLPDVPVIAGRAVIVGRAQDADIHLADPTISRRHLQLMLEGGAWSITDLGARNPARLLTPSGATQLVAGGVIRVPSGQILLGNTIVTLFPVANNRFGQSKAYSGGIQ
jgi:heat shock protein HtpX